ncbi:hypothetical protein M8C21_025624 [Ambrosia artemisiifolia]|uniref:Uncharacterized protein n=1 Tax=Ambrosia artemisiifolia TaxID=4212 RepID=A0AAD5GW28_AMBAR|nr:hypothetical protein M8C21_025624 [Ambrosia artemisiifolia]
MLPVITTTHSLSDSMATQQKPKILIVAYPTQGHINPSLRLANRLVNLGVDVTFSTSVSVTRYTNIKTTRHGLTFAPFSDGHHNGLQPTTTLQQFFLDFSTNGASAIAEIINSAMAEGQPFDHLVYTTIVPWAAKVAHAHKLKSTLLWCQPAIVLDIYYYYFNGYQDLISCNNNNPTFPINLPGLPSLTIVDLPSFMKASSPKEEDYVLPFMKEHIDALKISPRILVNTFDALEVEPTRAIDKLVMLPVGPLVPSNNSFVCDLFEKPKEDYIEWLNTKPKSSVVYVSFGSMATFGRPFLWVIREGGQAGKLSKIEVLKKQGMIVSWCSQVEVLNHQAVGCFLMHGGWNSTVEALAAGVPVVAFPLWADQWTNAKMIEDVWKVGVKVKRREGDGMVEGKEIKRCVEMVMEDVEIRRNAEKWKELASHINPSLRFANCLLNLGVNATYATSVYIIRRIDMQTTHHGLTFAPFSDGHDDGLQPTTTFHQFHSDFSTNGASAVADIISSAAAAGQPFDHLVYTSGVPWAAKVANAHNLESTTLSIDQVEEMAFGLVETGRPFLWVIRDGGQAGKLSKIEVLKKQGMIVSWCSQVEVLNHQAVGCFLMHGGWNSTVEALAAGVPSVVFSQWSDQAINAKMIEHVWETGIKVKRREGDGMVEGKEIKRCVEMVMEDVEMRRNAEKWRELARQALSERKTKILIVAYPTQGHINPSLRFANRLGNLGVNATYATSASVIRRIDMQTTHHGLTFAPFSDGHHDGLQPTTTLHQFHSDFSTNCASAIADIISSTAAAGQPFDHLVYTNGVPWAAKVANAHSLESNGNGLSCNSLGCNLFEKPKEDYIKWLNAKPKLSVVYVSFGSMATLSIDQALEAGVPSVVFSQWSDQAINAKMIEDVWKTGVKVKRREGDGMVEGIEIKRCVEMVMEDGEMRRNAEKWRELARQALSEGGSSAVNLQAFVENV